MVYLVSVCEWAGPGGVLRRAETYLPTPAELKAATQIDKRDSQSNRMIDRQTYVERLGLTGLEIVVGDRQIDKWTVRQIDRQIYRQIDSIFTLTRQVWPGLRSQRSQVLDPTPRQYTSSYQTTNKSISQSINQASRQSISKGQHIETKKNSEMPKKNSIYMFV